MPRNFFNSIFLMKTRIKNPLLSILSLLLACSAGHASYQQDNWYELWKIPKERLEGVTIWEDPVTSESQIYVIYGYSDNARINVYDMNGSFDRVITIGSTRFNPRDLTLDSQGNIYIAEAFVVTCLANDGTFKWRKGKGSTTSGTFGTTGSGNGEFRYSRGITIGHDNLFT